MRLAEDGSATKSGEDRGEEERREEMFLCLCVFGPPGFLSSRRPLFQTVLARSALWQEVESECLIEFHCASETDQVLECKDITVFFDVSEIDGRQGTM